jgi:hypothetical protein
MNDERLDSVVKTVISLTQQLTILDDNMSQLRASIQFLKVFAATQLSPSDPAEGLERINLQIKSLVASDESSKERQQASDSLEALTAWMQRGKPPLDT